MTRSSGAAVLLLLTTHCGPEPEPRTAKEPPASSAPSAVASAVPAKKDDAPPKTEQRVVKDTYHGVTVEDAYRWLEDSSAADVKAWNDAQSAYTRKHLDALPGRKQLRARFTELLGSASADHFGLKSVGKKLFAIEDRPPKQQPFLVVLDSPSAQGKETEKVVLDPNVLDPSGGTTIDWYVPSHDGKLVAISLSKGGSESGDLHVYEVASGKELGTPIARVHGGTAGGSLSWNEKGTGFWYTRYPRKGERDDKDLDFYQQVWFHDLNKPESTDRLSLGKALPRIAEIELESSSNGRFVLASVKNGDGGEHAFYVLDSKTSGDGKDEKGWKKISDFADKVVGAQLGEDGGLWLRSINGAPRGKILRTQPDKPDLAKATVVVPESERVIQLFEVRKNRLFVADLVGGPSLTRVFELKNGKATLLDEVPLPKVSSVRQIVGLEGNDGVLVRIQSYTEPPSWYEVDAMFGVKGVKFIQAPVRKTGLFQTSKADFSDTEVVREMCTSKDGTKVPVNILRKKGTNLDGSNPTLLYGYGGYSISLSPRFQPKYRPWLEAGGVLAIANLRGGGEFGDAWHEEGKLLKKQNVFDDFYACAQHLVSAKYTSPQKLAIMGGSNGGLLMGAALTQHPEAFRAVVSHVGIYDMLRVETTPNGAFNVTEFGTVNDKAQFEALYAYSPYHHVKDGATYPAVLFMTGANDPRVDPYHSRKMTARLQAASPSSVVLLRTSGDTGHGMGTPLNAQIEEEVDQYSFLFAQLGMTPAQ